jgi:hypothetical protein
MKSRFIVLIHVPLKYRNYPVNGEGACRILNEMGLKKYSLVRIKHPSSKGSGGIYFQVDNEEEITMLLLKHNGLVQEIKQQFFGWSDWLKEDVETIFKAKN